MKKFSDIAPPVKFFESVPTPMRKEILHRGKRIEAHEVKKKVTEQSEIVEYETTSVIDILKSLTEDTVGRVSVVEGDNQSEVFVDYETSQYLLAVYESLDEGAKSQFENTLIENIDNLDEIALYCESVVEASK